jgi:hypothetical protein
MLLASSADPSIVSTAAGFATPFCDDFSFLLGNQLAQLFIARRHQVSRFAQNFPTVITGEIRHNFGAALREGKRSS